MLPFMQRYSVLISLLPLLLVGLALGHLAASGTGLLLLPPTTAVDLSTAPAKDARQARELNDYAGVLQRNLFDSRAPAIAFEPTEATGSGVAAPPPRVPLNLIGTVAAGSASLAMIAAEGKTDLYHLGDEVPGGGTVQEITRNVVHIEYPDGATTTLNLLTQPGSAEAGAIPPTVAAAYDQGGRSTAAGIRQVADNRWIVDRGAVETARGNMNQLLQQARMEPYIVDGQTRGFQIKWVQRNSLIGSLGLRPGDIVVEVNNVKLDSPEKALMIFQQLREARTLSIGLIRSTARQVFQYEFK